MPIARLLSLFLSMLVSSPTFAADWQPLFNGENLDGWRVECKPLDRKKAFWKVEDGAIVCDSMSGEKHDYVWLMTEAVYGNFELKLKVQTFKDSPGNSGVQVRSRFKDIMVRKLNKQ